MNKVSLYLFAGLLICNAACGNSRDRMKREPGKEQESQETQLIDEPVLAPSESITDTLKQNNTLLTDTIGGSRKINKNEFLSSVWNYEKSPNQWVFLGNRPAIIDFYADWCGPCRMASPILEEISYEFAGKIVVYKIDTQKEQELAAVFGIRSIPAFLYIPKTGKPVLTAGIARTKEETKQMFIDNINNILLSEK